MRVYEGGEYMGVRASAWIAASIGVHACFFNPESAHVGGTVTGETGETGGAAPPGVPEVALEFSSIKQFHFGWTAATGAQYYQLLERVAWETEDRLLADKIVGESITLTMPLHLRFLASYVVRACNDAGCTDSEPVSVAGSMAAAVGYVKPSNTDAGDSFGDAVALSGDGQTLAIGAPGEDGAGTGVGSDGTDDSASGAGAVYVFARTGNTWTQQAYLKASNTGVLDGFGSAVTLSSDGDTLVVGAPNERSAATDVDGTQGDNSLDSAGAAYVFVRSGEAWSQQAYLKSSAPEAYGYFGGSLSLAADGHTLAVGAFGEQVVAGAVHVFERDATVWSSKAVLTASDADVNDAFGTSVALSADGRTLAVGAPWETSGATGVDGDQTDQSASNAGAVYMFMRLDGPWSQRAYVKASNTGTGDEFGTSVALSGDGTLLAVGAPFEASGATGVDGNQTDDSVEDGGAVYIFTRKNNTWSQQVYLKPSAIRANDRFGSAVTLSFSGTHLAVGAPSEDGDATGIGGDPSAYNAIHAGAVSVFVLQAGVWAQHSYVKASNTNSIDGFGAAISVSADANILAVGAIGEDSVAVGVDGNQSDNSADSAGAVYLY